MESNSDGSDKPRLKVLSFPEKKKASTNPYSPLYHNCSEGVFNYDWKVLFGDIIQLQCVHCAEQFDFEELKQEIQNDD